MAQLIFFNDNHRYELDGEPLPSVSEVLRFLSREIYGSVQQYTLDHAASRGSRVHAACALIDQYGEADCDDDIIPYVQAYVQFLREHKPRWNLIEKPMHHPTLGYAGTLDRAGTLGDQVVIVDLKAQEQIKPVLVSAQLNGYAQMQEYPESYVLYCLQLKKDGTYKLRLFDNNPEIFYSCLDLHKALAPKKKGAKTV